MRKRSDIRNFYVDEEFIPVWDKFREICTREDSSASEKIRGFIARYVAVHAKGNPQLLLDKFVGDVHHKCFGCEGMFKSLTKVKFVSGRIGGVCPLCKEDYCARGLIKKVLGAVGRKT